MSSGLGVSLLAMAMAAVFLRGVEATPLDDYVNRPDPTYTYNILLSQKEPGYTLYTINMTSQTWMPDVQSQPVWWHYLYVTVPDVLKVKDAAFLYITGGSNKDDPSSVDLEASFISLIGSTTGTISAYLKQVPNQPIVFKNDPSQKHRSEDGIISWTWKMFIDSNGSNPEILGRMPMTKAAVRALDTVTSLGQKVANTTVNRFVVAGASKRGWTTWTVGAVDSRVIAIAPIVMDLLDMVRNLHHFYRGLGGWPFTFADYYDTDFMSHLDEPVTQAIADIVDPISYNDRYANKPKYIITSTGDEFFMPDDSQFFYNRMMGETHLRMIPNAEHSMTGHVVSLFFGLRAFYLSVIKGKPRPISTWNLEYTASGGRITVKSDTPPSSIIGWHATTLDGDRRDFRLVRGTPGDPLKPQIHPVLWFSKCATSLGNNTYRVEMENPRLGWTAFFIEMTFPGLEDSVLEFTTETLIIPNTYPFPDCQGAACKGVLL